MLDIKPVTEETISRLLLEGKIGPKEFGLVTLSVRYFGVCGSSVLGCQHSPEEGDVMLMDEYHADDSRALGVSYSELTCVNAEVPEGDVSVEGIGGKYEGPSTTTFSYLSDDAELSVRVYARALRVLVGEAIGPEMLTAFRASLAAEESYGAGLITEDEYGEVGERTVELLGSKHYDFVPTKLDFGVVALDEKWSRDLLVDVLAQEIEESQK